MTGMGYSMIKALRDKSFCAIDDFPEGMKNFGHPCTGDSMDGEYAAGFEFSMSKQINGTGIKVGDAILNALGYLIVSERLKNVLEAHASGPIEFLSFKLRNHKGRLVPGNVYVVNVLGRIDCADPKRSEGRESPFEMDEGAFIDCQRLALDERKVPKDATIFRTTLYPEAIFVRDDVRAAIEAQAMTVRFIEQGEKP
jgi:hypothetical protein